MDLKFKYAALVDYDEDNISRRHVTDDLNEYILDLYDTANKSKKIQFFEITSETTQVISIVLDVINRIHNGNLKGNEEKVKIQLDEISERLRFKEKEVQNKVQHLNDVKKGSLIQAIFKDKNTNIYEFFISKAEHNLFMEEIEYNIKEGFRIDNKNLWKSCVVKVVIDDNNLEISEIRVYLDNKSVYWYKEFLEIKQLRNDGENTRTAFTAISSLLKGELEEKNAKDYDVLKKSIYNYMKTEEQFDYNELMENKIVNYKFDNLKEENKKKLFDKLEDLPKKKKFDTQFDLNEEYLTIQDIKEVIPVSPGIDIITKDMDSLNKISSKTRPDGSGYIMIDTNDQNLLNRFKRD